MKALLKTTLCAFALSLVVSCNTENTPAENGGNEADNGSLGQVTLNLGFEKAAPGTQAYTQSTAKPTTTWQQNIQDLQILFIDAATHKVKAAREITLSPEYLKPNTEANQFTFLNIPVTKNGDTYNVYVVANSKTGANIQRNWEPAAATGYNDADLVMTLITKQLGEAPAGGAANPEADCTGYTEPAEIFIGATMGATVQEGQTNTIPAITLQRAIGMMRVRINQTGSGNESVNFQADNARFRIRRAGTAVNLLNQVTYAAPNRAKAMMYITSSFNSQEPTDGYGSGTILDPTNNLTLWKDIRILPGGSATEGNEKFDIVLIGHAPATYIPLGKTTPIGGTGGLVAWSGAVQGAVTANNILEVNLTLNSRGKWIEDPSDPDPGIPEPGAYGNVLIDVTLAEWGTIESVDMPL